VQEGALVADKYRILRKLGEGGMGSVWLAKNEVTERDFAIKFLHPSADRTEAQLARFFQEAKVAGKLRHPSIVEIFDAGSDAALGDAPYLVMECLEGIGLDEAITKAGALPLGIALEITLEVCRALGLAHEKGIIHRDLKPSNVFLHRVGNGSLVPKVLDFGISKVLVDDETGRQVTGMTRTGAVLGSPLYMSPEQAAGDKSIDARSDVHAIGVMLWECLVGRAPFTADTYGLLLVEIIQGERPALSSILPNVPAAVSRLVGQAIARDRSHRFTNAGEMAEAIERVLGEVGHRPVLSRRDGAERFFELVAEGGPKRIAEGTRTTAALEVPLPGSSSDEGAASAATDEPRGGALTNLEPTIPVHRSRAPLVVALTVIAAGVAGGGLYLWGPRQPAQTEEATEPLPVESASTEAVPATAPEPVVEPATESAEPEPSASVAPSASSAPRPIVRSTKPKATSQKPDKSGLPAAKPKPTATSAPVHHGVTSSGL
jgi:serine/threonine-protein kinase